MGENSMVAAVKQYLSTHKLLTGMLCLSSSCLFWALNYVLYKVMVTDDRVAPAAVVFWIFGLGGAVLSILSAVTIGPRAALRLPRRQILPVIGQGFCGLGLTNLFIIMAERITSAIHVIMLEALIPVCILLGSVILGYRLKKTQLLGMLFGLGGCLLVIQVVNVEGLQLSSLGRGDLLVSLGAISWAVYVLWGQKTQKELNTSTYSIWTMFSAAAGMLFLLMLSGKSLRYPVSMQSIWLIGFIILFPTAGAFFFWTKACMLLPLPLLNITQYMTPLLAVILARLILHETVTPLQWLGMGLIVSGIVLDPAIRAEWDRFRKRNGTRHFSH